MRGRKTEIEKVGKTTWVRERKDRGAGCTHNFSLPSVRLGVASPVYSPNQLFSLFSHFQSFTLPKG